MLSTTEIIHADPPEIGPVVHTVQFHPVHTVLYTKKRKQILQNSVQFSNSHYVINTGFH